MVDGIQAHDGELAYKRLHFGHKARKHRINRETYEIGGVGVRMCVTRLLSHVEGMQPSFSHCVLTFDHTLTGYLADWAP